MAGWLVGGQDIAADLPLPFFGPSAAGDWPSWLPAPQAEADLEVSFPQVAEAARDLARRRVLTRPDFDALSAEARAQAFTVARVSSLDTLEKLRTALVDNIAEGDTLRTFRQQALEALDESALAPGHVENVYRTGVGQAYKTGQLAVLDHPLVSDQFPYVAYHSVHDARRRPTHAWFEAHGLDGTNVYRRDDPTIRRFWAPWDYQCRCAMTALAIADAARLGVREAQEWLRTGLPPREPQWVRPPDFGPSPGFASGPSL